MEDTVLATIKAMFTNSIPNYLTKPGDGFGRGQTGEFETLGNPLDETKMYVFDGVLVIFSTKTRVTEKELNNFLNFASENSYTSGIVIGSPTRPSESVLTFLRNHIQNRENPPVQIFEMRHLQFDISKHRYVPPHRIITDKELDDMMKEFNIKTPTIIPKIDSQDPMSKWIGARPGDVIEILGLCESSADNRRYRYCVADVTNG
jgi:DNA-directed RNA polymerase subunit H (RpoH/RPB5)